MSIPDATTVATPQRWWKRPKVWFVIVAAVLAVALVLTWAFSVLGGISLGGASANASEKGAKPTSSASPSPTATSDCPAEFQQIKLDRSNHRVDPRYEGEVRPLITQLTSKQIDQATFDKKIAEVELKLGGTNAQTLAISAFGAGLYKDSNDWKPLVEGDCLSEAGRNLYYEYKGALNAKGTSMEVDQADPVQTINSGVNGDQWGQADTQGVSGDLTIIRIKFADGSVAEYLVRCKNLIFLRWISVPKVPTDNPPPTNPPGIEAKNPSKDVGVNPNVDAWKQDATGGDAGAGHQVSDGNGAQVSNGYQGNPAADAAAAKAAADAAAAQAAAEHQAAVDAANKAAADAAAAAQAEADRQAAEAAAREAAEQNHTTAPTPPPGW